MARGEGTGQNSAAPAGTVLRGKGLRGREVGDGSQRAGLRAQTRVALCLSDRWRIRAKGAGAAGPGSGGTARRGAPLPRSREAVGAAIIERLRAPIDATLGGGRISIEVVLVVVVHKFRHETRMPSCQTLKRRGAAS